MHLLTLTASAQHGRPAASARISVSSPRGFFEDGDAEAGFLVVRRRVSG
jgi:hypothetical protein